MNEFEDALGRELERLEAPAGFADLVMERVARREQARRRKVQGWRLAIAASLLVCVATGGYQMDQWRRAEAASEQFAVALRVTNRSLAAVDRGLARIEKTSDETNGAIR